MTFMILSKAGFVGVNDMIKAIILLKVIYKRFVISADL